MAPSISSRQIIVWTLPALFLLSFLWFKRKKSQRSDPGGTDKKAKLSKTKRSTSKVSSVVVENGHCIAEALEKSELNFIAGGLSTLEAEIKEAEELDKATKDSSTCLTVVDAEINLAIVDTVVPAKIVEGSLQSSIHTTDKSVVTVIADNISEEIDILSLPEVVNSFVSIELNPEAVDFIARNRVVSLSESINQTDLDTIDAPALSADLEWIADKINQIKLITENSLDIPINTSSIVNCTSADKVPLAIKEEEVDISTKVIEIAPEQTIPEEDLPAKKELEEQTINLNSTSQSWASESELELDEAPAEMAREVSDVAMDEPVIEEDCTTRNLQVEASSLESKLSTLELEKSEARTKGISDKVSAVKEKHGNERDSANHSPAEVMLGSPSISSNFSDVHSEGSSDSGKGCSDVATPPSRTPASGCSVSGDPPSSSVYEFVLPQFLVGRLIGRHGDFVHKIKAKTHANILIKRHPETAKLKICAIEGSHIDIEGALEMIRLKFPIKRYPSVTLEQVSFLTPTTTYPLMPESFQLQLIEGVNNDVILSSLVSPAHFFLQQPTHPTFPSLNRLNLCMNICYSEPTAPALPSPVGPSVICVAPTMGGWYRAQVIASDPVNETSDVKFIDYGGYLTVDNALLRQIRSDFITLPFQAAECYLANVKPKDGVWAAEAIAFVEELTHGQVIQAQIYGYAEDNIPVVYLFSVQGSQVLVVNRELVLRGYAEWDEPTEEEEATETPAVEIEV